MEAPIEAAFIGFLGALVGLIVRDVVMAVFLAKQKRQQEISDREDARGRANRDLVRAYSDPLLQSAGSLRARLDEIINSGRAEYLLPRAPKTSFNEYKKISTIYRLAVVLAWIRAFRRERSYLDPVDQDSGA